MIRPEVEAEARRRWAAREASFPRHARMPWERGSGLARAVMIAECAADLGLPAIGPAPQAEPDLFFGDD